MSDKKEVFLSCIDYTVSNKKFDLLYNEELDLLETFPQPAVDELPQYYESDAYISHTDSSKSFIDKAYQVVKLFALQRKLNLINSFKTPDKTLLDVGCGTGDFLATCEKKNWKVVGVEPNEKARSLTKSKLKTEGQLFSHLNEVEELKFDVISLWHVLEHVPNLNDYLERLKSLLKPNGVLVVAVPNFKCHDASYYGKFWAAYDVPRHLWHFSKKSIEKLFLRNNLKLMQCLPMHFDSFYVSMLSEKHKTGKNNLIKAFVVGFISNFKALRSKEYSSLIYVLKR